MLIWSNIKRALKPVSGDRGAGASAAEDRSQGNQSRDDWNQRDRRQETWGQEAWSQEEWSQEACLAFLREKACRAFRLKPPDFTALAIEKQSVDARDKENLKLVFSLRFSLRGDGEEKLLARRLPGLRQAAEDEPLPEKGWTAAEDGPLPEKGRAAEEGGGGCKGGNESGSNDGRGDRHEGGAGKEKALAALTQKKTRRPVIAGSGPAGLFAALTLAEAGLRPLILERGPALAERIKAVEAFWAGGPLEAEANVQFGEGGAGTFSDGKLTTGVKDRRCRRVLEALAAAGGPPEILYQAKPHIGTDRLRRVLLSLRQRIESLGGEYRFRHRLTGLILRQGGLAGLEINEKEELPCGAVILALGHSARDTFAMLHRAGLAMEPKAFSIGLRIEHSQEWLNRAQYGAYAGHPALGAADYKLSCHLPGGRSVYTFCMCPGGLVVAAASEAGCLVTNGMSYHRRRGEKANSGLLVSVGPADFPLPGPLGGVAFQREYERLAFRLGGGDYRAPAQYTGDFLRGAASKEIPAEGASYMPGVRGADLNRCLPEFAAAALREALPVFDRQLPGFASEEGVLTGIESRSSSPLRIQRDAGCRSPVSGIYPCGEGAGYAGGILSAAADGIRCAEALLEGL